MLFVIEPDTFGDETDTLVSILDHKGIEYHMGIPDALIAGQDVFIRGSVEFCETFDRHFGEDVETACPLLLGDFTYTKYTKGNTDLLLNGEFFVTPWWYLQKNTEIFFELFGFDRKLFIRPDSGKKIFTGTTFGFKYHPIDLAAIKTIPGTSITDDTFVIVSPEKEITYEYRLIVDKGKVVSYSHYDGYEPPANQVPVGEFEELAQSFKFPHETYVLDIALSNGRCKIVEANSLSSAGWYNCDFGKIVDMIMSKARGQHDCEGD